MKVESVVRRSASTHPRNCAKDFGFKPNGVLKKCQKKYESADR